jgi:uncharacterized repeat protein (TIGR03803 family)
LAGNRQWDGLQDHPKRHADDAAQLLLAKRFHRWRTALRRAGPGHERQLLRDNAAWRGQRLWYGLQDDPEWQHSFDGNDGSYPAAGLVQATNGNFYGTTYAGGDNGAGTVFEMTAGRKLTTLYSFCSKSGCTDGANPSAGLVQATNGNFWGTTVNGGVNDDGTVFEIIPGRKLTTLSVSGHPYGGLLQATNGKFYGTTYFGGADNDGTVFSLSVGLGPFVETLPTSGSVGTAVIILGNNLTGATGVSFNGKAATFKVVSGSEITTTVPSGATTGKVKVKTPHGTLTSNVNFRVP